MKRLERKKVNQKEGQHLGLLLDDEVDERAEVGVQEREGQDRGWRSSRPKLGSSGRVP